MNRIKKIILACGLISFVAVAQDRSPVVDEAFVTSATADLFPLLDVLVESIHHFSTRPIIAYGINADIPFSSIRYPRLIKRRLDTDQAIRPGTNVQKFYVILTSNVRRGIYMEANDIANQGIDTLFAHCKKIRGYPLCPLHPRDPINQQKWMKLLGVTEKTNPYVRAHIIFAQECMPFIQECYKTCLKYQEHIGAQSDELILNVLLWKHKVHSCYLPTHDPFYTYYQDYINEQPPANLKGPVYYYMFHGCKHPIIAKKVLEFLKTNTSKSVVAKTA